MNRFLKSFQYAFKGIWLAIAEQRNLKIHICVAIVVVSAGFYFGISKGEWLAIVLAIGLVMTTELINTSIEHIVNLVSPQHQPRAGKIKDIAAGAVLVAVITSVVIGLIIFGRHLLPNA